MRTILLLTISNIFMTFAWYGHLKYRSEALWKVILASWGIAFFEYCFQVPANRVGSYGFTTAQLKTIQEVITLSVFSVFSVLYLGEKLKWNYVAGFGCIALAHEHDFCGLRPTATLSRGAPVREHERGQGSRVLFGWAYGRNPQLSRPH